MKNESNPVSKTAVTTLALKAAAGNQRAKEIYQRLGLSAVEAGGGEQKTDPLTKLCFVAIHDLRHETLDRMIEETGCGTVFDLPCGYTSRCLDMTDKGIRYIGGDLPEVISRIRPVIEGMASEEQLEMIQFADVDVTDYSSMLKAVENAQGPICIATEGLTMYLNEDEKRALIENVYQLLLEKGGCWLFTDAETLAYYMAVITSVAGEKSKEVIDYALRSFAAQSKTDILSNATGLSDMHKAKKANLHGGMDYRKVEEIYTLSGLKLEKIPYYREDLELSVYRMLKPETSSRMKEATKKINIWKYSIS